MKQNKSKRKIIHGGNESQVLILCHDKKVKLTEVDGKPKLENHWIVELDPNVAELFTGLGKTTIDTVDIKEGGTFEKRDAFNHDFIKEHLDEYDLILVPDCSGPWGDLQLEKKYDEFLKLCVNLTKMLKSNGTIMFSKFYNIENVTIKYVTYERLIDAVISTLKKNGFVTEETKAIAMGGPMLIVKKCTTNCAIMGGKKRNKTKKRRYSRHRIYASSISIIE